MICLYVTLPFAGNKM